MNANLQIDAGILPMVASTVPPEFAPGAAETQGLRANLDRLLPLGGSAVFSYMTMTCALGRRYTHRSRPGGALGQGSDAARAAEGA